MSPTTEFGYLYGMPVDVGGATAIGRRAENQDRWAVAGDARWALVCDGVGGAAGGGRAADQAVAAAAAAFAAGRSIEDVFAGAHEAVVRAQQADPDMGRMATTLTVARQRSGSRWLVAAAGDSPAFLVDGAARRLLSPHTVADELVAAGAISASAAQSHPGRNSITRGIGHATSSAPDSVEVDVPVGASLVLASDGIDALGLGPMTRIVHESRSASVAAADLVEAALVAGASDNVTVVVVRAFGPSAA